MLVAFMSIRWMFERNHIFPFATSLIFCLIIFFIGKIIRLFQLDFSPFYQQYPVKISQKILAVFSWKTYQRKFSKTAIKIRSLVVCNFYIGVFCMREKHPILISPVQLKTERFFSFVCRRVNMQNNLSENLV